MDETPLLGVELRDVAAHLLARRRSSRRQ